MCIRDRDYDELMNSINNVLLPSVQDDYTLHPGHMEITTVGREKELNPVSYTHLDVYKRQIQW